MFDCDTAQLKVEGSVAAPRSEAVSSMSYCSVPVTPEALNVAAKSLRQLRAMVGLTICPIGPTLTFEATCADVAIREIVCQKMTELTSVVVTPVMASVRAMIRQARPTQGPQDRGGAEGGHAPSIRPRRSR